MAKEIEHKLQAAVDEFFNGFLGLEVQAGPEDACSGAVTSMVQFTGGWSGHCAVRLEWEAARFCTAAMLGMDETELTEEDVIDAVGEFSNVIAGMMQLHLPASTNLSLPVVVEGHGYRTLLLHTKCVAAIPLYVSDHHIGVTIHSHTTNTTFATESIRCAS